MQVRAVALTALVELAKWAGPELRGAALLPLIRRHMQPMELDAPVQRALAALFPAIMDAVGGCWRPLTGGRRRCGA
jgi:serine/threonine-protein phosphatase 4 regulatory subunit 4